MSIIFIEGNIGAGKSTFLAKFESDPKYKVIYEPVDEWMEMRSSDSNESILELFYKDKEKYGFMFQMLALQTRIKHMFEIINNHRDKIIICERSYFTDNEIFAKMLFEEKILNEMEYNIYNSWHSFLIGMIKVDILGIIYIKTSPEVCCSRISRRNREGEGKIHIEYINKLHSQHEKWLLRSNPYPVFTCDGDQEDLRILPALNYWLESLLKKN